MSCLHWWNRDSLCILAVKCWYLQSQQVLLLLFSAHVEAICLDGLLVFEKTGTLNCFDLTSTMKTSQDKSIIVFYLATANTSFAFSIIIIFQICEYLIILRPSLLSPTRFKTVKKFRKILWETQIYLQTNWSCCLIPTGKQPTQNHNLLQETGTPMSHS